MNSRILIVDDRPKNIQILANHLTNDGYDVEYATSGKEAIKILEKEDFDLILLDVMMPGIDGFETCKRIKKLENKNNIPIIFVTAKTDIDSITLGFEYGGVDYISKPFKADELLVRVKTHIELKKAKDMLNYHKSYLEKREDFYNKEINKLKKNLLEHNKHFESIGNHYSEILNLYNQAILKIQIQTSIPLSLLKSEQLNEKQTAILFELEKAIKNNVKEIESIHQYHEIFSLREKALKLKDVFVAKIIAEAINSSSKKINLNHLNINTNIDADIIIKADEEYIKAAFVSLLDFIIENSEKSETININVTKSDDEISINIIKSNKKFDKDVILYPHKIIRENKKQNFNLFLSKYIIEIHNFKFKIGNNNEGGAYIRVNISK
ncbi:MAG TPA: response regulator [Bacteroidales bacterium]|jgi:DNA-binding response OmpR family regulator|nr:response regulator [Bacteroidales bacterium]HOL97311.1 response regulator [Bacteroidales bacterium]HOM36936.1 response regulator [Bacteroidales bacterium]HPD22877.1 response regulator [Bacteroidales bacterium]HRS98544.1 response regulator [Bacteroidales bacterium]